MTRKPIWIAAGVVAAVALVALYVASPWMAAARLSDALKTGDPAAIDRMVDFPAVRASLSSQIQSKLNAEMRADPETANNPFAGLVTLLAPAAVNAVVSYIVTPEGLAKLSKEAQKADAADAAKDRAKGKKRDKDDGLGKPVLAYAGLNTFTATYTSRSKGEMVWTLGREKFFFWKLKKVEVSEAVLDDLTEDAERRN